MLKPTKIIDFSDTLTLFTFPLQRVCYRNAENHKSLKFSTQFSVKCLSFIIKINYIQCFCSDHCPVVKSYSAQNKVFPRYAVESLNDMVGSP